MLYFAETQLGAIIFYFPSSESEQIGKSNPHKCYKKYRILLFTHGLKAVNSNSNTNVDYKFYLKFCDFKFILGHFCKTN